MIRTLRTTSQQLESPSFDTPKELVSWMGALQGQDYQMAKWAVGIRLKFGTLHAVEEALRKGEIIRTHIMRPTWHLVAAEDIRWMLPLSATRIRAALESYGRQYFEVTEEFYLRCIHAIEKTLEGHRSMTKQEIGAELGYAGITIDAHRLSHLLMRAETEAILCSGADNGKKATYALFDERVPSAQDLPREEALARLARSYFRSHSPASLNDFTWWSGLSQTEARQGIHLIASELTTDRFESGEWYVHDSCPTPSASAQHIHLLPSFDEYLISYKDRTDVLEKKHHPKAFTNNGIFYPVILEKGQITGNWKKSIKKGQITVESSFFAKSAKVDKTLLAEAIRRYVSFMEA